MPRNTRRLASVLFLGALAACSPRKGPLITIEPGGAFAVNGTAVTLAGLPDVTALRETERPVRVRVSPDVPYLFVDSLQKALQRMNVSRIVFEREK